MLIHTWIPSSYNPWGTRTSTERYMCGVRFQKSVSGTHITDSIQGETRIPRDMCAGNTLPEET